MASRWLRGGVGAGLGVLLFFVLVLVNYLSARHFFQRFDLTRSHEFTVAPATRKVLASLDDVVNVKLYFSRNLPERVASIPARVRDLLDELAAHARGKLRVESVDPQASPEVEQRVRAMGIPRVPLTVLERNRQQTVEVYLGLALMYGDKKEVVPAVFDNTNLEYEVVSRILKMTRPKKSVGFLAGSGAHEPYGDYGIVAEQLRRQYDVESVDLGGEKAVPEAVATLIVAGPKSPVPERARYEIDQFLMRGGRAIFLLDAFDVEPSSLTLRPVADAALVDQVASYGVRVKPALVADWGMNEVVQMPGGEDFGGVPMYVVQQYPLWPKLLMENMSETHPTVSQLPSLVLPFTSPVEAVKDAEGKREVTELLRSTELSSAEERLFTAHPRSLPEPRREALKQYVLAAAVSGPQKSAFTGKPVPAPAPKEGEAAPEPAPPPSPSPERRERTDSTQLVVVGGSEFASDPMLRQRAFAANAVFFLNAVDWLTMGDELIGIRSRLAAEPLLDPGRRELGEKLAPWFNIVLVPVLVVVAGVLHRAARRSRRVVLA